jgi:hypothetical protein
MKLRRLTNVVVVTVILLALNLSSGASATATISVNTPCGDVATTTYTHVVWIMLENQGYSVVGSPSAPYFNELSDQCGLATSYYAISHPSLPNYVALTSGSPQGITDDGEPNTHRLAVASIFSQLGSKWRTLVESMPSACDNVTSGLYAARHNPAVYYTGLKATCRHDDVPMSYPLNLSADFTIIVPNVCDDMHSCPVSAGDAWLKRVVPLIVKSSQYQSGSLVLFITFDENDLMASNKVPTLVIAPTTPRGTRVAMRFNHYSLLRTTEALLHVSFLGGAKTAASMVDPFHL